jgi:hypothetical protein
MSVHFRLTLYTTHNFSCFREDNLGSTLATLDMQTKDCCLNSVIRASPLESFIEGGGDG